MATPLTAVAREFVCWPIARGDSAATAALRLTGNAASAYGDTFQIRDPERRLFVPKSQYARLGRGWQACVDRAAIDNRPATRSPVINPQGAQRRDVTRAWQFGLAVSLLLLAGTLLATYTPSAPVPPDLQRTGEQFIRKFAQPLIDPSAGGLPIKARLRYVRHVEQLEIFIAPNAGRRYPNLLDHKTNFEYDINRVVRTFGGRVVVSDHLRAEGTWVVVPIRLI